MKNNFTKILPVLFCTILIGISSSKSFSQCSTPTATYKCCGIGIMRVELYGQFSKTVNYNQSQAYYDFYNSTSTCINKGDTVYMAAQVGANYSHQAFMYIDWDKNDTFDASELLLQNSNIAANDSLYGYFVVPLNAASGAYRMRLGSDYSGVSVTNDPCTTTYGDFWDVQIDVNADTNFNVTALSIGAPASLTIGQNDTISLTFSNHSDSVVDSVRVSFSFDGNTYTEDLTGINLSSCGQYTHKFAQTISPSGSGMYTVKAWVKYPNGNNPDANIVDDTASLILCTGIQGTFTVDPSSSKSYTNYHKLSEVASLMRNCYISGHTVVKVKSGTYSDSAYFSNINGLSSNSTLTIDGGSSSSTKIIGSKNVMLGFEEASYITVKNLYIENNNTTTTTKVALTFTGNITDITVDSCSIKAPVNSNNYYVYDLSFANIFKGGQGVVNNVTVSNTKFSGGYMGVYFPGDYTTQSTNFTMKNCDVADISGYSIYLNYIDTANITGNYVYSANTSLSNYGMYTSQCNQANILSNKISTIGPCIYAYYPNDLLVQNNFLWGSQSQTIIMYNFGGTSNVKFYHNSIRNYAPSGSTGRTGIYIYGISAELRNNIISVQRANNQCLWADKVSTVTLSEYNNFYGDNGADMVNFNGAVFNTVSSLKGYSGLNNNVFNQQPAFISNSSPYNLHLQTNTAPLQADSLAGVSTDIDGDQRCYIAPQLGADECKYSYGNPLAKFSVSDTLFVGSPFTATNLSTKSGEYYDWYIDGSLVTGLTGRDLVSSGIGSTGSHDIKLSVTNCVGTHDTTISVYVTSPTSAPKVNFTASDTVIDQNGTIYINNYTVNGPQTFNWTISPGTYGNDWIFVNGTDTNSYMPYITFVTPGVYNVCLTSDNSAGSSQLCKSLYIKVYQVIDMGTVTYTNSSDGKLFDDGGKYAPHGSKKAYDLLISPCAKDVTIEFDQNKWDLGYTAWIGIWDGTDSISGKPLHTNYGYSSSPNLNKPPAKITAKSGSMYIYFYSSWWTGNGFEAKWYSTPGSFPKPSAAFTVPDTVYIGSTMPIKANYWDRSYSYSWDYENDGTEDATGWKNPYTFSNAGTQTCRLIVTSCGGVDTVDHDIVVLNPSSKPVADFAADFSYTPNGCNGSTRTNPLKATVFKTLSLVDKSQFGPTGWDWDIQPSGNVSFDNGTSNTDQNPDVSFVDTGYYTVSLTVTNAYGYDIKTITNYIYVSGDYCYPTCSTFQNTEAGVSNFSLGDINNTSDIGTSDYWDNSGKTTCLTLGGKYKFSASRNANSTNATCWVWIDYNIDGVFQTSEKVYNSSLGKLKSWTSSFTVPTKTSGKATNGFTKVRVAVIEGNSTAACGTTKFAGEYEDYGIFLVDDYEGPVIKLTGGVNTTVEQGRTYLDSGATATDNIDGNVPVVITGMPLNTSNLGTYMLTFNATDSSGNKAVPVNRYVTVTPDKTAPYLALIGNNPDTADANVNYTDPGVVAYDSVDGNIAGSVVRTGSINVAVLGSYQFQYKVTDKAGYTAGPITRDVIVLDRVKPVITLSGANPYIMHIGDTYVEPGYSATDNYSKNLTVNVNPASYKGTKPDTIYITYTTTDSSGNVGTVQRMVIVTDNVAPVIKLTQGDTIYHEAGYVFVDPGYSVTDDYDTGLGATVIGSINIMQLGTQSLTYVTADQSGNSASKTRTVIVQKTKKPVLILNGKAIDSVLIFNTYTDPSVTIVDSFYNNSTLQPLLSVTGSVNTSVAGTYTLTYSLTDPSNIKADDVNRSVVVYQGNAIKTPEAEAIQLFPNPANNILNLVFSNTTKAKNILVYNQAGQMVYNAEAMATDKAMSIPVSDLSKGMYYIAVVTSEGRSIAKFVKE